MECSNSTRPIARCEEVLGSVESIPDWYLDDRSYAAKLHEAIRTPQPTASDVGYCRSPQSHISNL